MNNSDLKNTPLLSAGVRNFAQYCTTIRRFHMIGIGGIGMSGLAELLLQMGYEVSGSDLNRSPLIDHLISKGAVFYEGHAASNIATADTVVYSAAVSEDNPERVEARNRGLVSMTRADLLAAFVRQGKGIGVAGTHGKTTTSAMIGLTLLEAEYDPTIIVGGIVPLLKSNVYLGNGPYIVVEADEYNRSFLGLAPSLAVITTVDTDHLEYYGSQDAIDEAFISFANSVPCYDPVVLCYDDPGVQRILQSIRRRVVTYGFSDAADIQASQVTLDGFHSACQVSIRGREMGTLRLQRPGRYHILNALAAIATADLLDIPFDRAQRALEQFTGVERRFEVKGQFQGITLIDDYAHHPVEVKTLLESMKAAGNFRVVAIFQPHLFSRTRQFVNDFGEALALADLLFVTDIYPSRERPIPGISGALVAQAARNHGGQHVEYVANKNHVADALIEQLKAGDVVVTIGAGDITRISDEILHRLATRGTG